jgi:SAM-dependent methyltransferase
MDEAPTAQDLEYAERIHREKLFHNERFAEDNREAQDKYYRAIEQLNQRMDRLIRDAAAGKDVLEYGCAQGGASIDLAPIARSVHGIDISDVAIEQARAATAARGIANVTFSVADAMATGIADGSFDTIFGSGIIHHLDTERSLKEIKRLLRPGGVAIFKEPLGENLAINLYRRATPDARTIDEHPLVRADFTMAQAIFKDVELDFHGLFSIAAVPFRKTALFRPLLSTFSAIDRAALTLPGLRWQAWYVLMVLRT